MLFNSTHFIVFFPIVTCAYFLLGFRYRWVLLLVASYYFYMAWEPAYAALILTSTAVDYLVARGLNKTEDRRKRKLLLILSLVTNLTLLFFFKYYNFFAGSLQYIFTTLSLPVELPESKLLLPIGISFYTFQTLSYTIECYKNKQQAENHFGIFALYVAFFPQLVAGPIERPQNLIHQLRSRVNLDYGRITLGLKRMAWGMFKKVVIADRLSMLVDSVYSDPFKYQGPEFIVATIFFAFQIYCDFSGYSDIAIGAAKILGVDLMENFKSPYHSHSMGEFWRRWHISLSTWFRDYVYFPLGGYNTSISKRLVALIAVFLLSGLWHGANWTFVVWGGLHGLYLMASLLSASQLRKIRKMMRSKLRAILNAAIQIAITFVLVNFAWIFFRADSLNDAFYIISHLNAGWDIGGLQHLYFGLGFGRLYMLIAVTSIAVVEIFDIIDAKGSIWQLLSEKPWWIRWSVYYAIVLGIFSFGVFNQSPFIYFQF